MLNHFVIGPTAGNRYLVAYRTPGCLIPTTVEDCPSAETALGESARLNQEQFNREKALQAERALRGLGGVYPELGFN